MPAEISGRATHRRDLLVVDFQCLRGLLCLQHGPRHLKEKVLECLRIAFIPNSVFCELIKDFGSPLETESR